MNCKIFVPYKSCGICFLFLETIFILEIFFVPQDFYFSGHILYNASLVHAQSLPVLSANGQAECN